MASPNYAPLIAVWPGLTPGTTGQKLAQLNAMTVTGSIPAAFFTTGDQLLNCLDWTEFASLTSPQQTQLMQLCATQGQLLGGAASFVGKMFVAFYAGKLGGPTIAALTALAKAAVQPWWAANGYGAPINTNDLAAAGGLT